MSQARTGPSSKTPRHLAAAAIAVVLTPSVAHATDYTGIGAYFGVPIMAVAAAVFAVLASLPRVHRGVFVAACVVFVPLALLGVLLGIDAAANFDQHPANAFRAQSIRATYLYFALATLCACCFGAVVYRRLRPAPRDRR